MTHYYARGRLDRTQEVAGSTPASSMSRKPCIRGASVFLGWGLDRRLLAIGARYWAMVELWSPASKLRVAPMALERPGPGTEEQAFDVVIEPGHGWRSPRPPSSLRRLRRSSARRRGAACSTLWRR
jgi:hypothetical protein